MTDLQLILAKNKINYDEEKPVKVGTRVVDGKKVDLEFTIKKLDAEKILEMQFKTSENKNYSNMDLLFDCIRYGCENPNFRDISFHQALEVTSPREAILKTLDINEITVLSKEIMDYSGMTNSELEEAIEETKNS